MNSIEFTRIVLPKVAQDLLEVYEQDKTVCGEGLEKRGVLFEAYEDGLHALMCLAVLVERYDEINNLCLEARTVIHTWQEKYEIPHAEAAKLMAVLDLIIKKTS
jgi:hypothetical protein